jgi:anthranilate phosphoribosyltransferase
VIAAQLERLFDRRTLTARDVGRTLDSLLDPSVSEPERIALLTALTARPESTRELAAFARELRRRARPFPVPRRDAPVDLCGTGGSAHPTFNVSTASAFVVAAAGVPVVKHGNRSARGPCGSSDLLEALGLPVTSDLGFAEASYRAQRIAFLHAPLFHPATRAVGEARRVLGVRTIFNRLGPLTNPARVPFQVVGVPDPTAARRTARVLRQLGTRRSLTVTAAPGVDELSPKGTSIAVQQSGARIVERSVHAPDLIPSEDRRGPWGPLRPPDAAAEVERIFAGGGGARRGSVLLTSGAALWTVGAAPSLARGVDAAREALDRGRAETMLGELRSVARRRSHRSRGR